jgi:hypothetical protein
VVRDPLHPLPVYPSLSDRLVRGTDPANNNAHAPRCWLSVNRSTGDAPDMARLAMPPRGRRTALVDVRITTWTRVRPLNVLLGLRRYAANNEVRDGDD